MSSNDSTPLSDEEREELEALRAQQAKLQQAAAAQQQRDELERLRKAQKYAKEDAEYYAEKARKKAEREKAREHPDYSADDVPPMPAKQKIVLAVFAVMAVLLVGYLIWFNTAGKSAADDGTAPAGDGVVASQAADGSLASDAA
ncbi:MAG: hypothetical protein KHY83_01715 [Coriobacteriia bacterium]|nr:hypothetical protein [Coriobacteriia bacterium]MBS5477368.1 hypothetical protein [Coriobacteriia bacterium]